MKVLITGITGQLGSYLAELYLESNFKVYGLIRRTSQNSRKNIAHIEDKLELIEGDLTDYPSLLRAFECNPDYVINCAAQSFITPSFTNPITTTEINYTGVLNLLEIIRSKPHIKFLQLSSSEQFGFEFNYDYFSSAYYPTKYQDEHTRMTPQSPYGISKLAAYQAVKLYRRSYGLQVSNLIGFNYESPRRSEHFVTQKIVKWLCDFHKWKNIETRPYFTSEYIVDATTGKKFSKLRLGNIHSYRDWTYAGDTAKAAKLIIEHDPDDFVVCSGETHKISEFLDEAFQYFKLKWEDYVYIDKDLVRPSEVDYLCGRNDKIKEVLGWRPTVTFKQLVKMMIDARLQ